jgi:hypothetical protein
MRATPSARVPAPDSLALELALGASIDPTHENVDLARTVSAKPMHEPTRHAPWGIEHVLADRRPHWMIDESRLELDVSREMTPDDEAPLEPCFTRYKIEWIGPLAPLVHTGKQLLLVVKDLPGQILKRIVVPSYELAAA